jgi:hypothetical protein
MQLRDCRYQREPSLEEIKVVSFVREFRQWLITGNATETSSLIKTGHYLLQLQSSGVMISVKLIAPIAINIGTSGRGACSSMAVHWKKFGANKHTQPRFRLTIGSS